MEKPIVFTEGQFTISGFDIKIIEGYEIPINSETGEKFPYCCNNHKTFYLGLKNWFDTFPNCCETHKQIAKEQWFRKEDYEYLPEKIIKQVEFTEYHIKKRIEIQEWYKDITDYIDYNVFSFGTPSIGLDKYLGNLKNTLQNTKHPLLPEEKTKKLISFIDSYNVSDEKPETDLNNLYDTYTKWINTFPFHIGYFKEAKKHFEKQLPFSKGEVEYNPYLGFSKFKIITQSELIQWLTDTTKLLLQKINSKEAVQNGLITNTTEHAFNLASESHRIRQDSLLDQFTNGEMAYVKVLSKWLTNEKNYFKEVTPLIKKDPIVLNESRANRLKADLIKFGFLSLSTINILSPINQDKLIEKISASDLPYQIAMLSFLGYDKYLLNEVCNTKKSLYDHLARTLNTTFRATKGNFNVINDYSKENRDRYTAHLHKETIEKDYQALK